MNIHEDLMFRNMNNGDGSNKDNPRFRNLKANNKEDLRLNSHNANNINRRFSNPRDTSNPNSSVLNLRASGTREDHNPRSLKENPKEEIQDIESKITRSLKTLLIKKESPNNWSQPIMIQEGKR
jgi:hypothetical protein